jgi:3-hydroxy-3-methylglutaryl CoA synthase
VDESDNMMNLTSLSDSLKWTKKLFLHLLEFTILNNVIILASYGSKLSHQLFRLTVRDLIQEAGRVPRTQTTRHERQAPSISQLHRLDTRHNKYWPFKLVAIHVLLKTKQQERNSSAQNAA